MAKYINSDILRAEILDEIEYDNVILEDDDYKGTMEQLAAECDIASLENVIDLINIQPAADVEPVIRCKDCKYNNSSSFMASL